MFVVPAEDLGAMAIPISLVPLALFVDGTARLFVLSKGGVVDETARTLSFPASYRHVVVSLSDVTRIYASKRTHSGAQFGSSTYSYNIDIEGPFETHTLVFSSQKTRDAVLKAYDTLQSYEMHGLAISTYSSEANIKTKQLITKLKPSYHTNAT